MQTLVTVTIVANKCCSVYASCNFKENCICELKAIFKYKSNGLKRRFSKWGPQGSWMGFQGVPQQKGELVLIPNVPTKPETAHKLCSSLKGNLYLYQILNAALVLIMNYDD